MFCPVFLFPSLFTLTSMTFSFKLNGQLVSVDVRPDSHSYVSTSCVSHLGLLVVAGAITSAVSVNVRDSWSTCVISLLSSGTLQDFDVMLGWDWQGQLKELCSVTETFFPPELVDVSNFELMFSNSCLLLASAQPYSLQSEWCYWSLPRRWLFDGDTCEFFICHFSLTGVTRWIVSLQLSLVHFLIMVWVVPWMVRRSWKLSM